MRRYPSIAVAIVVIVFAGCAVARGSGDDGRTATIDIRWSHFEQGVVEARAGEPITIRLRNTDPIEHEWMVGDEAMHERHRTGTEPYHDSIPTEVTLPPFEERVTTVVFDKPGDYKFICHLPGHEAYGMVGVLRVTS
jgi:uncharacterized cupredoxin-like copper-binding protein